MECANRAVVAAVDGCATGERTQAATLTGAVEPGMPLLAASGSYAFELFNAFAATGPDLAWRIGAPVSVDLLAPAELNHVITTLLDPHEVPGLDLAAAYHDRWEEESAPAEIRTYLRGSGEVLRSKTPDLLE